MRVLCFLTDLDGGGSARTMANLVNSFPAVGIEPVLAVSRTGGPARHWLSDPAVLRDLAAGRVRRSRRPLRRMIRDLRPDLVFSTEIAANLLAIGVASGARRPLPVVVRDVDGRSSVSLRGPIHRHLARRAYRRADAVVAASRGIRRELREDLRLPWHRVVTLPSPVEVAANEAAARATRNRPSPVPDRSLLVAIGCLTARKGFDVLLDTFARLRTEGVHLAILGDGPDKAALEDRARRLGVADRVSMPGFVPAPTDWLAHATVFVLSSRSGGSGHVIVEAMAARAPVIATDCPHGPADIIDHGKNGILVPLGAGLVDRLRDQIDGLLASPGRRRALSEIAAVSAHEFESVAVARRYADLFRRVVAERRQADVINGKHR